MKLKPIFIAVLSVLMILTISVAFAGGPQKDMVTGSGTWINGRGEDYYAEFNAHEATDHQPAKGYLFQDLLDGSGGFLVEVDYVDVIDDSFAVFGGYTVAADGVYENRLDQYRWTYVWDGGSGTEEVGMDYLRGNWQTDDPEYPNAGENEPWYGGNVQIHFSGLNTIF